MERPFCRTTLGHTPLPPPPPYTNAFSEKNGLFMGGGGGRGQRSSSIVKWRATALRSAAMGENGLAVVGSVANSGQDYSAVQWKNCRQAWKLEGGNGNFLRRMSKVVLYYFLRLSNVW